MSGTAVGFRCELFRACALRGEFIERGADAGKPFTHIFRRAAYSDADVFRSLEKAAGNNAGVVFFAQQLAERFDVTAGELREHDRARLRPDREQVFSRIEEIPQKSAVRIQVRFRPRCDLRQIVQGHNAEQFRRVSRHHSKQIIEPPHSFRQRGRSENPTAAQAGKTVGFRQAARRNKI